MLNNLKNLFRKKDPEPVKKDPEPVKKEPKPAKAPQRSPKEIATLAGEPYINVLNMEVNPDDINSGAFELDWNDKFVLNLIKAGYKMREDDTDAVIVDRWFQTICRNIALEIYEQQQADPDNRYRNEMRVVTSKDLGDGRSEIS
jgi:hypothetical protein